MTLFDRQGVFIVNTAKCLKQNVNGSKTVSSCALWHAGASTSIAKYGPVYIPMLQCPKQKRSYEFTRPLLEMFRTRIKKKNGDCFST
jgi:hypothetical protein